MVTNLDATECGLVVSENKTKESWLHKTLGSFSSSFDEQQQLKHELSQLNSPPRQTK